MWATAYLFVFGAGTMAGMRLTTTAIGLPIAQVRTRSGRMSGLTRIASGLISLGFGFYVAYQTGFVRGLFSGHA